MTKHHHDHSHDHDHDHEHGEHAHSMSVYEFLGSILARPLDETLLYNVCDPDFWGGIRGKVDNERTRSAFKMLLEASTYLAALSEDARKATLDAEYAQMFVGMQALMPPIERAYGMMDSDIDEIAARLGIPSHPASFIPVDHIANELLMLAPIDAGDAQLDASQMSALASFFERHPMMLLRCMQERSSAVESGTGFYQAIVAFAAAWLQWDLDAFNG